MSEIAWGPIIGVIVGFLLSQGANVVTWLLSSKKERQLVRLLVALEIEQNLALLRDYWNNVSLPPDDDEAERLHNEVEVEADRLARRAVLIPLPVLSDTAFKSQLSALPNALDEATIRSTWRVYEEIAQAKALHAWLQELTGTQVSGSDSFPSASRAIRSENLLSATFKTRRAGAIYDLRKTIQLLLSEGNPLNRSNPSINTSAAR